jgi:Rieske Fe-S protein
MSSVEVSPDPSRRAFLVGACALVGLGLGGVLLADDAVAAPGVERLKDGLVRVNVRQVPALRRVNGVVNLGNVKGVPTAIIVTGRNRYEALDLRCTHQGVTVDRSQNEWRCPAHGSLFTLNGAVEQGPAMRPLARVRSRFRNGVLTVG